jgi:hypothetical protein
MCERGLITHGIKKCGVLSITRDPHAGETHTYGGDNPLWVHYLVPVVHGMIPPTLEGQRSKRPIPPDEEIRHAEMESGIAILVCPIPISFCSLISLHWSELLLACRICKTTAMRCGHQLRHCRGSGQTPPSSAIWRLASS